MYSVVGVNVRREKKEHGYVVVSEDGVLRWFCAEMGTPFYDMVSRGEVEGARVCEGRVCAVSSGRGVRFLAEFLEDIGEDGVQRGVVINGRMIILGYKMEDKRAFYRVYLPDGSIKTVNKKELIALRNGVVKFANAVVIGNRVKARFGGGFPSWVGD